jgi:hypothetical protein
MKDANALNRGLWLGLAGIVIFAATLPLTRLAVGTPEAPHMSSIFVALARAALAATAADGTEPGFLHLEGERGRVCAVPQGDLLLVTVAEPWTSSTGPASSISIASSLAV